MVTTAKSTIAGHKVGSLGFGLMNFTWRPTNTPDEQAFAAMNAAVERNANFFVSGEFYGTQDPQDNLYLIQRYLEKYPENADKIVLSVKGGADLKSIKPDGSPKGIRKSIDNILEKLGGKIKLDVFCIARVDNTNPVEQTWKTIKEEYIDTGKIGGLCLSEVSATTLQKAVDIVPVSVLEVEVSLWATEIFENGLVEICAKNNIPIAAYSPLGRGFLTGQLRSPDDIPEGDLRRHFDRFQPENFGKNLELVKSIEKIAQKKGVTPAQLALAWVVQQGDKHGVTIIPIFGATKEEQVVENLQETSLSAEELEDIDNVLKSMKPIGGRYNAHAEATLYQ
ncbi:hypothetical protein ABW20_dc0102412 [Dactylellina cionopaga]|nr:hypothetical protein ABW20_dc0102412 [Dactylellina cionopaga]